jgi:hypothetical protein
MTKTIGIALFVAILGGTLHADNRVDCSKLDKYADGHTYHQGDVVWWNPGNGAGGGEYRCKDSTCPSAPTSSGWERAADCQLGTNK